MVSIRSEFIHWRQDKAQPRRIHMISIRRAHNSPAPIANPQAAKDGKLICRIRIVLLPSLCPNEQRLDPSPSTAADHDDRIHRKWASPDKPKEAARTASLSTHTAKIPTYFTKCFCQILKSDGVLYLLIQLEIVSIVHKH